MSRPAAAPESTLAERIRARVAPRTAAILCALVLELLLVLMFLTLNPSIAFDEEDEPALMVFTPQPDAVPEPVETPAAESEVAEAPAETVAPPAAAEPAETVEREAAGPPPVPWIRLSREEMATADIDTARNAPPAPAPARPVFGPTGSYASDDTPRVEGAGPNGEPLYAAAWYREPYDDELRGFLSAATGPGWGMIACRTVPNYRVEDCVAVGEYPQGSNIARAVLAAAWQFRVRPPRIGGRPQVGEWVRIRIDYNLRGR